MKRALKEYINQNCNALLNGEKSFENIYHNMFRAENNILAETFDGYRIKKYTYGEVKSRCEDVSAAIYEKIGATHKYVGLAMDNSVEWIAAFWGILKSGNKPFLINLRHPDSLTNDIIKKLDIKFVISDSELCYDAEIISFSSLNGGDVDFKGEFENELALATSATSLNVTICFYTGKEIAEQILCARDIVSKNPQITAHHKGQLKQLTFLPFYHIFGLTAVYFWFTYFGRTLVFLRDYSPDTILKTCRRHEVTHIFAVPMLWHTIEKQVLKTLKDSGENCEKKFTRGIKLSKTLQKISPYLGAALSQKLMHEVTDKLFGSSIKFCISGGSYIRDSALELINSIGYPLHNGYGMSEIGITSVELRKGLNYRNLNSIGFPFSSVEYRLEDDNTLSVKASSKAAYLLHGDRLIKDNEWFNTGDVVEKKDSGYFIIGRKSDTIIGENGENINPDMTEQYFNLPDAISFSIFGLKSGEAEKPTMVVQINKYLSKDRVLSLIDDIIKTNDTIPVSSRVKEFYITYDAITAQTAVKVSRKWLINAINDNKIKLIGFSNIKNEIGNIEYDSFDSNSPIAKKVREIIAEELGKKTEDIGDDLHLLSDLGVDSLQYFSIIAKIADTFNITNYSSTENYRYTVKDICKYLERHI